MRLKIREGPIGLGSNLNFHKMNRCRFLLVFVIVILQFRVFWWVVCRFLPPSFTHNYPQPISPGQELLVNWSNFDFMMILNALD